MYPKLRKHQIHNILSKISLSLVDQGLFSINNFVLNIFLARSILAEEYGSYSVAFAIFLFIAGFQNALITEPMSVLGPTQYKSEVLRYFKKLFWLNILLSLTLAIILIATAQFFSATSIKNLLIALAAVLPLILNYWFLRRFSYVIKDPLIALLCTIIYSGILLSLMFILENYQNLNGLNAIYLMGFSSFFAGAFGYYLLNKELATEYSRTEDLPLMSIISAHWQYGKWSMGSSIVYWLNSALIIPFTAYFVGLSEAGILRALQNFTLPVQQFMTAIGNYLLPKMSEINETFGEKELNKKTFLYTGIILVPILAYLIIIVTFRAPLVKIVFGNDDYSNYSWLLPLLCSGLLIDAVNQMIANSQKSKLLPQTVFLSQVFGAIVFLGFGIQATNTFSLLGAGLILNILPLVNLLVLFLFFYKRSKKPLRH